MSSEPERPIEKALRNSARERRDQAGDNWELHPVNRRLLQDAVAQRYGPGRRSASPSWASLFRYWLPKLTAGFIAIALLMIGIWLCLPILSSRNNPTLLARKESELKSGATVAKSSAVESSPVNSPASLQEREESRESLATKKLPEKQEELLADSKRDLQLKDTISASAPAPAEARSQVAAANVPAPPAVTVAEPTAVRLGGLARGLATAPAANPASAAFDTGPAPAQQNQVAENRQQFSGAPAQAVQFDSTQLSTNAVNLSLNNQTTQVVHYGFFTGTQSSLQQRVSERRISANNFFKAKSSGVSEPAQVLSYFQVDQSGSEMRVIDSDGSVYSGQAMLSSPPVALTTDDTKQQKVFQTYQTAVTPSAPVAASAPTTGRQQISATWPSAYRFRVVGTNQTSKQRVVFTGLLNMNNQPDSQSLGRTAVAGSVQGPAAQLSSPQLAPAANVSGTVQIGPAQPYQINAWPAPDQSAPH